MIYCIRFADVVADLAVRDYVEIDRSDIAVIFQNSSARRLYIRPPNQDGHVPEILVNDAFDAAGLIPPAWDVFWCD